MCQPLKPPLKTWQPPTHADMDVLAGATRRPSLETKVASTAPHPLAVGRQGTTPVPTIIPSLSPPTVLDKRHKERKGADGDVRIRQKMETQGERNRRPADQTREQQNQQHKKSVRSDRVHMRLHTRVTGGATSARKRLS